MTTNTDPLNSRAPAISSSAHKEGRFETSEGTKTAKPLTPNSKCTMAALLVVGAAGAVLVYLGLTTFFGTVGSWGYYTSIVGGGSLGVIGIGSFFWMALSNCKSQVVPKPSNSIPIEPVATKKSEDTRAVEKRDDKAYSEQAQAAVAFARQKLKEHPEIKPTVFSAGYLESSETNQPVNPEIALLTTLYTDVYFIAFEQVIKKHKDDPWSNPEVIQAADNLIKIGYAISRLTLEDLSEFLKQKGKDRSVAQVLTAQDSYQYRTFYFCTLAYHWIRGGVVWSKNPWFATDEEGLFHSREASKTHVALFYQKESIQFGWRMLYNDYCDRIRSYVNEGDLRNEDSRHFNWTKKDEGEKTFCHTPDSQPT